MKFHVVDNRAVSLIGAQSSIQMGLIEVDETYVSGTEVEKEKGKKGKKVLWQHNFKRSSLVHVRRLLAVSLEN